jgi:hypothetical protein
VVASAGPWGQHAIADSAGQTLCNGSVGVVTALSLEDSGCGCCWMRMRRWPMGSTSWTS